MVAVLRAALLLTTFCGVSLGDVKIFLGQGRRLEEPSDWTPPRNAQCSGDTLTMPRETVASLTGPLYFRTLVLPMNGEILLKEEAGLGPGGSNCPARELSFSATRWHHWWQPKSWNNSYFEHLLTGPGELVGSSQSVVPDADRVPCPSDQVVLSNGSAFRVKLEGLATVRTLIVNQQKLSTDDFRRFSASATGRRFVEGTGSILVDPSQEENCSDVTGCACPNARDQPTFFMVCEAVGSCPAFLCKDPIQPEGFCCPFCASVMYLTYKEGFQLQTLKEKLQGIIDKSGARVLCSISKRWSGYVQLVCKNKEDDGNQHSTAFTRQAKDALLADASLHITKVEAISSSVWISEGSSSSGLSGGLTAGLLVIFLLLAVIGAVSFFLYRKRRLPGVSLAGFDFVRFDRSNLEAELSTTPHDDLQPEPSSTSRKVFSNPLYSKEGSSPMPDKRENPVYGMEDEKE